MKRTPGICLLMLCCCIAAVASENPAVGKWACVSDDGHGTVLRQTLVLNDSNGVISGSIITAEEGPIPLIDPKVERDRVTFKVFINPNCTLLFNLQVEGKKLNGDFKCPEVSGTLTGTKQD